MDSTLLPRGLKVQQGQCCLRLEALDKWQPVFHITRFCCWSWGSIWNGHELTATNLVPFSNCLYTVKFELVVAVSTLDVLPCSLVDRYRRFGGVRCFHIWISVGPDTVMSVDWCSKQRTNNIALVFVFTVRPVLLPFSFGDRPMNPGQIITVPCGVIEGDRPITLHWMFNGNPITPRMGVTVVNLGERSVILSISSVQASHAGNYTCTAKNFAGIDHRSAELVVKGTHLLLLPDTPVL